LFVNRLFRPQLAKQLPAGVTDHGAPVPPAVLTQAAIGYPGQSVSARQGLVGGMYRGIKTITGGEWFGPMQPLPPIAPADYQPRVLDYMFGINMRVQPRTEQEGISFAQMISLADNYDLLRLVIETRKDQITKMPFTFRLKSLPGEKNTDLKARAMHDPRIDQLTQFWQRPDGVNFWQSWMRAMLEDLFVIDAVTMYPRRTKGGDIWGVDLLAGETIRRLVDAQGRTPAPPSKAYQQIIHGMVAADYSTDEMIYCPRNVRTRRIYGMSSVEQIILTVNLALRRQLSQLNYYTEGNLPEMLVQAPATWPAEEIRKFQNYFDDLAGDLAARRRVRWIPESKGVTQIKDAMLKDEMDEWLARVVCYCFSVPPTPFVKVMNRATSTQLQQAALQEGLLPLLGWVAGAINFVVQSPAYMNLSDIEFAWKDDEEPDALKQNQIDINDVKNGIRSIDQVLEDRGMDPIGMGHCIIGPQGPVMLAPYIEGKVSGVASLDMQQAAGAPPPGGGLPRPGGAEGIQPTPGLKLPTPQAETGAAPPKPSLPAAPAPAQPGKQASARTSANPSGREQLPSGLTVFNKSFVEELLAKAEKKKSLLTADPAEVTATRQLAYQKMLAAINQTFGDVTDDTVDDIVKDYMEATTAEEFMSLAGAFDLSAFDKLATTVDKYLEAVAQEAAVKAVKNLAIDESGIMHVANIKAADYAKDRAAELVGRRWDGDKLVDNPDPRWAITDATREGLRDLVEQAYQEGWTPPVLKGKILSDYTFSDARAETIARTEMAMASTNGTVSGWRASGVVKGKQSLLSADHDDDWDCECSANADEGVIDIDDDFQDGSDAPPFHPRCWCTLVASLTGPDEGEEEEEGEELAAAARANGLAKSLDYTNGGCHAVDLDGTLAHYESFEGPTVIGEPVPAMVERVKGWLRAGEPVKILTARVADDPGGEARRAIEDWSLQHLGRVLEVTNQKTPDMLDMWDDRAVQVRANTGIPVGHVEKWDAPWQLGELVKVRFLNPELTKGWETVERDEKGQWKSSGVPDFKSAQECEQWIKNEFGCHTCILSGRLDIGTAVAHGFSQLRAAGWQVHSGVVVEKTPKDTLNLGLSIFKTLAIPQSTNPKAANYWQDVAKALETGGRLPDPDHWGATTHPLHCVYHEVGHLNAPDAVGKFTKAEKALANKEVSRYAAIKPDEMIAEVFAGRFAGEHYSDAVMSLYKKYGGPVK
jgi:hypothetical protein